MAAVLRFETGVIGTYEASLLCAGHENRWHHEYYRAECRDGSIEFDGWNLTEYRGKAITRIDPAGDPTARPGHLKVLRDLINWRETGGRATRPCTTTSSPSARSSAPSKQPGPGNGSLSADPHLDASEIMRHNILLTDPYHPVVQEIVSSLKALEFVGHVFGASEEPERLCPSSLRRVYQVPRPDAEDYARQLLSAAAKAEADVVLPWSDSDARALAPHAGLFREAGHALVCLDPDYVLLCSDQGKTLQALGAASIPVPRSPSRFRGTRRGDVRGGPGAPAP